MRRRRERSIKGFAKLLLVVLVAGLGMLSVEAQDREGGEVGEVRTEVEERQSRMRRESEEFRGKLEKAASAEERQVLVEEFRAKRRQERELERGPEPEKRRRWTEEADPELRKRLKGMEERLQLVEELKEKYARLGKAEGEERQKLEREIEGTRERLRAEGERNREAMEKDRGMREPLRENEFYQSERGRELQERREEMEKLKKSLEHAPPEERMKLLSEYREKREAQREARARQEGVEP